MHSVIKTTLGTFKFEALKQKNSLAYEQLIVKTYRMGSSLSGRRFSTTLGDLITEVTVIEK